MKSNRLLSSLAAVVANRMNTTCPSVRPGFAAGRAITRIVLLLSLLLLLPASVQAQDYTYTTNAGSITITDYIGTDGSVIIPDTIGGLPVAVIGRGSFSNKHNLTSVTIPDSVTTIEVFAFNFCDSLTNVTFGGNVADIQNFTFEFCSSLGSVTIPESVNSIGTGVFFWCDSLTNIAVDSANLNYSSVDGVVFNKAQTTLVLCPGGKAGAYTIPEMVTTIGDSALAYCRSLTNVTISDSITSIEEHALDGCANLSSVTIGKSVSAIGSFAFHNCSSLTSIVVNDANPNYSSMNGVLFNKTQSALIQCPEGKAGEYTIPNSVTNVNGSAFYSCASLSSVAISDGVTTIGDSAFVNCTGLTNVAIGNGLATIGEAAFNNCRNLTDISVNAANPNYSSVDGVVFNKAQTTLVLCPGGRAGDYAIPEGVTTIGNYAFSFCTRLTNVAIPDSVTIIGKNAFSYCNRLSVTIGNGVTSIGDHAFYSCGSLQSVMIPDSVTTVGYHAFAACGSLGSVTIGSGVTSIADLAFDSHPSLTNITVDVANPAFSSLDGVLFDKTQKTLLVCPAAKTGEYEIPDSVTTFGRSAFYYCEKLTSVKIPDGVTSIGDYAFNSCGGLRSVTIPASVASIGYQVFAQCSGLNSVYFSGNAPSFSDVLVFGYANNVTVYYLPGTTGWGETLAGRPTALWNPTPLIAGPTDPFGFTITGSSNLVIVVEAAASLSSPDWTPVSTNTLTDGSSLFEDPQWSNHPARFYRLRSP